MTNTSRPTGIPELDPTWYLPSKATIKRFADQGWTVTVLVLPRKTKHMVELRLQQGPRGGYSRIRMQGAPVLNPRPVRSEIEELWQSFFYMSRRIHEGDPK
jgi:hypothetical protein